ncbi:MAG: hypothetical protein AAB944_02110, partial [Patescibacteria group bacterium]
MGHYLKFEIYVPTKFKVRRSEKTISDRDLTDFCKITRNRFGGLTQSNPSLAPPLKGWWIKKGIIIDYLFFITVLVELKDENSAQNYFEKWKFMLEKWFKQKFIL